MQSHRSRLTGTVIEYGLAAEFGMEDGEPFEEGGRPLRYVASCRDHGELVFCERRYQAVSSTGLDFCQGCRDAADR